MNYLTEVSEEIKTIYSSLEKRQQEWYKTTEFTCHEGCGKCCVNFEPDILKSEAVFMAHWLIQNQPAVAKDLAEGNFRPGYTEKTCIFFNPDSDYHCSIYGGRAFICRLFGASAFHDKDGNRVWRPCKFYPDELLKKYNPLLGHEEYSEEETKEFIKEMPPVMSDIMGQAISVMPEETRTEPLRDILPKVIREILFEDKLNSGDMIKKFTR